MTEATPPSAGTAAIGRAAAGTAAVTGAVVGAGAVSEAAFLTATRTSYDRIADAYTEHLADYLDDLPFDRALIGVFADVVRAAGTAPVADVGCGPGRVTALLDRLGVPAFGVDLSPAMIALARRSYPHLRFEVGSMLRLDLPDGALGGLLANYSIIHLPFHRRPDAFAEFRRVLRPGGQLMLSFQTGDDVRQLDEAFGHPVELAFHRQRPEEVAALLDVAGFDVWATARRAAEGTEQRPPGFLMARRRTGSEQY